MNFDTIVKQLQFTAGIEKALLKEFAYHQREIELRSLTAYKGENFDFELCSQRPAMRLAGVTYLLCEQYKKYQKIGVPENMIWDTFRDVALRAELYFQKIGEVGLDQDDVVWFRHIMETEIFQIGSLQFQPFEMMYVEEPMDGFDFIYIENAKEMLPPGSRVLNCHIPRGADLSRENVEISIQSAKQFFSEIFPDAGFRAILCYSWLLYPDMIRHLPADSRIRQFADPFYVIGTCHYAEQAMENLFGKQGTLKTSLQRMALAHQERFGFACGIILL
jgi:hypothetical protein